MQLLLIKLGVCDIFIFILYNISFSLPMGIFSEFLIVHFHSSSMSMSSRMLLCLYRNAFCFIIINSAVQIEGFESFDLLIFYLNSQTGSMFIYLFKFSFGLLSISPYPREYVSVIIF